MLKRTFRRTLRIALLALAVWVLALPSGHPVLAQDSGAERGAAAADIEQLLKTIEDDAERAKLIKQLKTLLELQKTGPEQPAAIGLGSRLVTAAAEQAKSLSERLTAAAASVRDIPEIYHALLEDVQETDLRKIWVQFLIKLAVVIVAGIIAHFIARGLLRRPRKAIEDREVDSVWVRLPFLIVRTALDLVPVIAFVAAGQGVLALVEPKELTRSLIVALLNAYLFAGIILVIARMILVPRVSGLRMLPVSDLTSNYLFIWARRFTYIWIYGFFLAGAGAILGLDAAGQRLIAGFVGLLILAMGIMFVLQNRQAFGSYLRGDPAEARAKSFINIRNRFADVWHALAIIYISAIYVVWVLQIDNGFAFMFRSTVLTLLVIVIAQLLVVAIRRTVRKGFSLNGELRARYPALEARANRYLPVLQVLPKWLIYVIAVLSILSIWGVDIPDWLVSDAGRSFVSALVSITLVLIIALVIWEGASTAIERYLDQVDGDDATKARRARTRTLLPLLRNALMFVIVVMVALVILSELGINIGPLLAGAGVAGLAIGFGSQKLVQDVITGAFILFEDSMAVGDVVRLGGTAGVVEQLSIRSIRLRDLSGNVHVIPFSSIDHVANLTKEFSYYVFEVGVAYRESVDEVIAVLKELGAEMEADPEYGPLILEPLDVLGVDQFADSAVVIKARYKTVPIKQWMVGREFNRRMKNRFDELGIEIPFPHQTLYFGVDKDGKAPPLPLDEKWRGGAAPIPPRAMAAPPAAEPDAAGDAKPTGAGQEGGDGE